MSKPKDANKLGSESRGNDDDLESTRMVVATYNTPQGKHSVKRSSSGDKSEGRKNELSSASNVSKRKLFAIFHILISILTHNRVSCHPTE